MGLRDNWNDLGSGAKVLVAVGIALLGLFALFLVLVIVLVGASFMVGAGTQDLDTSAPQSSFDSTVEGDTMTITLKSGEAIQADEIYVIVGNREIEWEGTGLVTAGDSMTVTVSSGDEVKVVWRDGESSRTMYIEDV